MNQGHLKLELLKIHQFYEQYILKPGANVNLTNLNKPELIKVKRVRQPNSKNITDLQLRAFAFESLMSTEWCLSGRGSSKTVILRFKYLNLCPC